RRPVGDDHLEPQRAGSRHVRARRPAGGALGEGAAGLVHDERGARIGCLMVRGAEMQRNWSGVGTALVTPFDVSGELDEAALRRLVERQGGGGVGLLVARGPTGART